MIKKTLKSLRRLLGMPQPLPAYTSERASISSKDLEIIDRVTPYTMTGIARTTTLIDSVRYCVRKGLPGAFAECGVWRGGSVLAMILTLQDEGVSDRDIWLYDTFEGMTEPTERDISPYHVPALQAWKEAQSKGTRAYDFFFDEQIYNEDFVRNLLTATGYPQERLHFIRGPVEQTIPSKLPDQFALLRLDTDWYESTQHEMEHMYPRLAHGGILIIDDYGHWSGSQVAVDEYFAKQSQTVLLSRIDYAGRLHIKY